MSALQAKPTVSAAKAPNNAAKAVEQEEEDAMKQAEVNATIEIEKAEEAIRRAENIVLKARRAKQKTKSA